MDARRIDDRLTVSHQILPEDVPAIARAGFAAVICNRPDNEEPGQPSAAEIRAAVEAEGLAFHHLPTTSGVFPPEVIEAFREVRRNARGPVFAYCRTGTRCVTIDALANPDGKSEDEIISAAAAAGYDLSPLRGRIGKS
ncbi:MAG: TIGR01244 family sulfur transferase [Novosphingobium sp.]|nr:TIGR01244 family sulfur transferase [Novosphingobium sp.]